MGLEPEKSYSREGSGFLGKDVSSQKKRRESSPLDHHFSGANARFFGSVSILVWKFPLKLSRFLIVFSEMLCFFCMKLESCHHFDDPHFLPLFCRDVPSISNGKLPSSEPGTHPFLCRGPHFSTSTGFEVLGSPE